MKRKSAAESAFFSPRFLVGFILCLIGAVLALFGFGLLSGGSASAQGPNQNQASSGVEVGAAYRNDVSPPMRDVPPWSASGSKPQHEANENPKVPYRHKDSADPVIQKTSVSIRNMVAPNVPSPLLNFDGIPFPGVGCNCAPPDTNGAVGKTQYVQIVNEGYQVFDKATGNSVLGPNSISSVWTGFGGVCETSGSGDPVMLYDHLADRWVITQFAGASGGPITDECVAVSTTADATGTYNRYGFHLGSNFFDYPKLSVWPDAYYMSMNVFNAAGTVFLGPQPYAMDRAAMLSGAAAALITPGLQDPNWGALLPGDLDGSILPPAGAPDPWLSTELVPNWQLFRFHVDFAVPANRTFTLGGALAPAAYATFTGLIPQLGTASQLDSLADRPMFRPAYRRLPDGHEALMGNQTVASGGVAGIRWWEINNATSGAPAFSQQGTYQPDATYRWMGSVAMDASGNMALGFSASSAAINPQVRYAGRLLGDPPGTLAQGEATLHPGTGSQVGTSSRWGDYSDMTVDPADDCTFWYTTEYYDTTTSFNWRTRIGNFKFPTCIFPVALQGFTVE